MSECDQELCPNWSGDGNVCPCAVFGIERPEDDILDLLGPIEIAARAVIETVDRLGPDEFHADMIVMQNLRAAVNGEPPYCTCRADEEDPGCGPHGTDPNER